MLRQIAEVAETDTQTVGNALFDLDLQRRYEAGKVSTREFYEEFCRETGTSPKFEALLHAGSDIFKMKNDMLPLIEGLERAGYSLGILSNTCDAHWEHCLRRFSVLDQSFPVHALSYRMGVAKPDAEAYEAAAELAGLLPTDIFFVDDLAANVAGAKAIGFDAVQYVSTPQLVADLRERGLEFER